MSVGGHVWWEDAVVYEVNAPSAYRHRPELQPLFRSWRAILDSYPAEGFPGPRTAVGEVWYDVPETLAPYLQSGGLPQVFNFQLILAGWRRTSAGTTAPTLDDARRLRLPGSTRVRRTATASCSAVARRRGRGRHGR